ncbi:MAG: hypothetical protein ABR588_12225 [Sphingomicrobium sp.]|nr:hypothetical protein [Sphingomonadales bacterium]
MLRMMGGVRRVDHHAANRVFDGGGSVAGHATRAAANRRSVMVPDGCWFGLGAS